MSGINVLQQATLAMMGQSHKLNTIGQNIVNVNTDGYKRTDTNFQTLVSRPVTNTGFSTTNAAAGSTHADLGGVLPTDSMRIDQQGQIRSTQRQLDLAISGNNGFFMVSPTFEVPDEIDYTRRGSFQTITEGTETIDPGDGNDPFEISRGYLGDQFGNFLLGVEPDANGDFTTGTLTPMRVDSYAFSTEGDPTENAVFEANLPASLDAGQAEVYAFQVVDSEYNPQTVRLDFTKAFDADNTWDVRLIGDNVTVVPTGGTAFSYTTSGTTGNQILQFVDAGNSSQDQIKVVANTGTVNDPVAGPAVAGAFAGLRAGDTITIGSATDTTNDGTYTIASISDDLSTITLEEQTVLTGDVRIRGGSNSYIPVNSSTAYVQDGDFSLDASNNLIHTASGLAVTSSTGGFITIPATAAEVNIQSDGDIQVRLTDQTTFSSVGSIQTYSFADTSQLTDNADGTFTATLLSGAATSTGAVDILTGPLSGDDDLGDVALTSTEVVAEQLTFNQFGEILTPTEYTFTVTFDGENPVSTSTFTLDISDMTQFDGGFIVRNFDQDGEQAAELLDLSFDSAGHVVGDFTDGTRRMLYKVPLAHFANPNALDASLGPVFSRTELAGERTEFFVDELGIATLIPLALEGSNVDLATEMGRLIEAQQSYNLAAQAFTTADEMLQTAGDLKR